MDMVQKTAIFSAAYQQRMEISSFMKIKKST
jgi:hypothetical protein